MNTAADEQLNRFLAATERRALVIAELATHNRDEALDLVQDAMLAFVRRYSARPQAEWPPLFHRILQNRIRDWGRRSTIRRRWRVWLHRDTDSADAGDPVQSLADPNATPPDTAVANEAAMRRLADALQGLPERQRQAVVLRLWEGLDVADTARAMGCSAGSVKTHLSRALGRLRACLEDAYERT